MSEQIADVSRLNGMRLTTTSGNSCVLEVFDEGSIRFKWKHRTTDQDRTEVTETVSALLGGNITVTTSIGKESEARNHAEWKRRMGLV